MRADACPEARAAALSTLHGKNCLGHTYVQRQGRRGCGWEPVSIGGGQGANIHRYLIADLCR